MDLNQKKGPNDIQTNFKIFTSWTKTDHKSNENTSITKVTE